MFVIPMAGLSSRFFNAGYMEPKFKLKVGEKTVFEMSIESFEKYFESDYFLFIVRSDFNAPDFVKREAKKLGILRFDIVTLDEETRGQAETVALGLKCLKNLLDEPVYIFNIDTFRPGYRKPVFSESVNGYLETFVGSGSNWSNIVPLGIDSDRVARTAEKQEVSEYCCTGLYYWDSAKNFLHSYENFYEINSSKLELDECYIAPIYNFAIASGADIRFTVIPAEEVVFCGTPSEYKACQSNL